jgi:hypothetical protein
MIRNFYAVSDEHIAIMTEYQCQLWINGDLDAEGTDTISIYGPLMHNGKRLMVEVRLTDALTIEEWHGCFWKTPVFGWSGR